MSNTTALVLAAVAVVFLVAAVTGWAAYVAARARSSPAAMREYEQALADMQTRLERTERRGDRLQMEIDRLRDALVIEREYSYALARAMRDAGLEPPRRADAPPPPPVAGGLTDTATRLAGQFAMSELDDLAMEAGLLEVVAGDSIEQRASSLALAALRRGQLEALRAAARRERPNGGF